MGQDRIKTKNNDLATQEKRESLENEWSFCCSEVGSDLSPDGQASFSQKVGKEVEKLLQLKTEQYSNLLLNMIHSFVEEPFPFSETTPKSASSLKIFTSSAFSSAKLKSKLSWFTSRTCRLTSAQ